MIKRMLVATAILFGVLLFMLPKSDEGAKRKMASAAMLMCSNDYRKAVAQQLLSGEEPTVTFRNSCPELIAALETDEEGVVTLRGAQHGVVMELSPVREQGKIRWSCRGEPPEAIAKLCKP